MNVIKIRKRLYAYLVLLLSLSANVASVTGKSDIVNTRYGTIRGTVNTVHFDNRSYQITKFLGIPYAEPPVGDLRLKKTVKIPSFSHSHFDATSFGPACPGSNVPNIEESEDCLTLNIFAPSSTNGSSQPTDMPVMVFIHGGGFVIGTSRLYDGSVLSVYAGVVVVTLNYRIGTLGFFSFENDVAPGNYGLWDQHVAIKWVKDNIGTFGGNPDNITIFGESAGSSSVIYQLAYSNWRNEGLFQRAIAESGSVNTWAMGIKGEMSRGAKQFAERLGCNQSSEGDVLTCMRAISSDVMAKAVQDYMVEVPFDSRHLYWVPVYDNEFVPTDPFTLIESMTKNPDQFPYFSNTELMIGMNNYDGGLYFEMFQLLLNASSVLNLRVTSDEFKDTCAPLMAQMFFKSPVSSTIVKAVLDFYSNWDDPTNDTRRLDALASMSTDAAIAVPTVLTAIAHTGGNARTYLYEFAAQPVFRTKGLQVPTVLDGPYTANHGDEIPFVFGFNDKFPNATAAQLNLTKVMMTMWSNFAKTGDPNSPVSIGDAYQGITWPTYNKTSQEYLLISPTMTSQSAVKSHLKAQAVNLWHVFLSGLQQIQNSSTGQLIY